MRAYTEEEVRAKLLQHIHRICEYWEMEPEVPLVLDKLRGVAFSILTILDGQDAGFPAFIVAPDPPEDDSLYHWERGENWYPDNTEASVKCNIAGGMHGEFIRGNNE